MADENGKRFGDVSIPLGFAVRLQPGDPHQDVGNEVIDLDILAGARQHLLEVPQERLDVTVLPRRLEREHDLVVLPVDWPEVALAHIDGLTHTGLDRQFRCRF